ncbi:MAG: ankyrin repeat domain-containing protein [Janthinobacterium lividum]
MRPTTKRNRLPLTRFTRVGSALLAGLGLSVLAACQSAQPLAFSVTPASTASTVAQGSPAAPASTAPLSSGGALRYDEQWFAAARMGRTDILQALIDAHQPLDVQDDSGYTALILASYREHRDALAMLMNAHANACLADKHGNTALMGALFRGRDEIARDLLHADCDLNQTNNAGESALAFAALFGRTAMMPVLVAHGADVNHRDARGNTPYDIALQQGNQSAADALQQLGGAE